MKVKNKKTNNIFNLPKAEVEMLIQIQYLCLNKIPFFRLYGKNKSKFRSLNILLSPAFGRVFLYSKTERIFYDY